MQLLQLSTLANTGLVLFLAVVSSTGVKGVQALPGTQESLPQEFTS